MLSTELTAEESDVVLCVIRLNCSDNSRRVGMNFEFRSFLSKIF